MLLYAIGVFAFTACLGLILAAHVLRDKFAPWVVSLLHALSGATGLFLLLVTLVGGGVVSQRVFIGFMILLAAAMGGFFLATFFHARKRLPYKPVVIIHAALAVAGFLTLVSLVV